MEPAETFIEDFLEHHGVKGMKWGVRRDQALLNRIAGRRTSATGGTRDERKATNKQNRENYKAYKSSTTRKERRIDRKKAVESKANFLVEEALKNPTTLMVIRSPGNVPTLTSGKEFIDHLSRGGYMDPIYTDITDMRIGDKNYNARK